MRRHLLAISRLFSKLARSVGVLGSGLVKGSTRSRRRRLCNGTVRMPGVVEAWVEARAEARAVAEARAEAEVEARAEAREEARVPVVRGGLRCSPGSPG